MAEPTTDEQIELMVLMAERGEAWAQIEGCTVGEGLRRLLRAVRTMSLVDARIADNRSTMALMAGPVPPSKM